MNRRQLRLVRTALDLSQTDLAKKLGRSQAWVSRLEAGVVQPNPQEQAMLAGLAQEARRAWKRY